SPGRREDDQGRRAPSVRRGSLRGLGRQGGQGHPRRQALARRSLGFGAEEGTRPAAEERQAGAPGAPAQRLPVAAGRAFAVAGRTRRRRRLTARGRRSLFRPCAVRVIKDGTKGNIEGGSMKNIK